MIVFFVKGIVTGVSTSMGLKQMPEDKGIKKLDECRLIRAIDLTGE